MLWDLIQQVQIRDHQENALSLERRVKKLEKELHATKESLHNLTKILESKFGEGLSNIPDHIPEIPEINRPAQKAKTNRDPSIKTRDELLKEQIRKAKLKRN